MSKHPVIIVQGGAGAYLRLFKSDTDRGDIEQGVIKAASAGFANLLDGGSAVDAVVAAVSFMEDSPLFNGRYTYYSELAPEAIHFLA